jgi:hypothetical protein
MSPPVKGSEDDPFDVTPVDVAATDDPTGWAVGAGGGGTTVSLTTGGVQPT